MTRLTTALPAVALAAAAVVAIPAGAEANPTHTNCTGSTVRICVSFQDGDGHVRAYSRITDRSSDGRYQVAVSNTRVQYLGWDGAWHTYQYPAGDYDGWKGNYDNANTGWLGEPCADGAQLRAVTTAKYRIGSGPTRTVTRATSSHMMFC